MATESGSQLHRQPTGQTRPDQGLRQGQSNQSSFGHGVEVDHTLSVARELRMGPVAVQHRRWSVTPRPVGNGPDRSD